MPLLKRAVNETAYFKGGVYGGAGSGKTMTAAMVLIGLAEMTEERRPVAFFDTETGSDFVIPLFRAHGIELLVAKSRAFKDLLAFMKEAEEAGCAGGLVDSVTHVWAELRESYEKKLGRKTGLEIWDWGKIKPEWRQFTDAYLTSKMHMVICGRSGNVYEQQFNEEKGKNEVVMTGTKMKAETEMSYEPSLLFEMERVPRGVGKKGWTHRLTVLKDRFDVINGEVFAFEKEDGRFLIDGEPAATANHVVEVLMPHIACLNLGGEHNVVDTDSNSQDLFTSPDGRFQRKRSVDIALEEIKEAFVLADCAGTSKDDKKRQTETLIAAFGTSSWTAIQNKFLEELQAGLVAVRVALGLQEKPMSEDEIDAFTSLLKREQDAGKVTAEESNRLFAAVLHGEWGVIREAWEAMETQPNLAVS